MIIMNEYIYIACYKYCKSCFGPTKYECSECYAPFSLDREASKCNFNVTLAKLIDDKYTPVK